MHRGCLLRDWLRIIHTNDVYELNNLPRLANIIKNAGKNDATISDGLKIPPPEGCNPHPDHTIAALSGDFLSPGVLSSLDRGKAMIDCLNAIGISHVCFGNHEADIDPKACHRRIKQFRGKWLNSNMPTYPLQLPAFDQIKVGKRSIALLGFVTNSPDVFRDGKFKGVRIDGVGDSAKKWVEKLHSDGCDAVVCMTHQSIRRDRILANEASKYPVPVPYILGGHEHELFDETVEGVSVVKTGSDAQRVAVVDLMWDNAGNFHKCHRMIDLATVDPDPEAETLVCNHLQVVEDLKHEDVIGCQHAISSVGVRKYQTSIGMIFATACRSELDAEIGLINGGPIKGNKHYPRGCLSYLDMKQELPFPTKMVVCDLPGKVLGDAIWFSRNRADGRGFLQVCNKTRLHPTHEVASINGEALDEQRIYKVALPRNLLTGFCKIEPLTTWAEENPHSMPEADVFIPAFNLVLAFFAKSIWHRIGSFDEIDVNNDGIIESHEVRDAYARKYGKPISETMLNTLMESLDSDRDGHITREEHGTLWSSVQAIQAVEKF